MGPTSSMTGRLGLHFAACAVVTAAAAQHAAADVNYWPNANLVIPANVDGLYINVETRATGSAGSAVAGWDINPYSATSLTWFNATGTGMLRFPGVTTGSAGSLDLNTPVEPTGSYGSGAVTVGSAPGNWRLNSANYFAFRFTASDGLTHYGWGKFQIGSSISGSDRTITELAWETLPNTPILVGNGGGPPPDYDPCATFNPTISVGNSSVAVNQATAANLVANGLLITKANYYKFTPSVSGAWTFSTCAAGQATRMAVLADCTPGAPVLATNDNGCGGQAAVVTAELSAGTAVYVVVGGEGQDLTSPIAISTAGPPDEGCVNASVATYGSNPYDISAPSTAQQVVQSDAANTATAIVHRQKWFKFRPSATGQFSFKLCGPDGNGVYPGDTKMAVGASCPTVGALFNTLAYNDDAPTCLSSATANLSSWIDATNNGATGTFGGFPLTQELIAGQDYYVCLGMYLATTTGGIGSLQIDGPQGPSCPADLNGDTFVNGDDLGILLSQWGECTGSCSADFNGDGFVNGDDLGVLLAAWGACP
jgi:hypothetical protein